MEEQGAEGNGNTGSNSDTSSDSSDMSDVIDALDPDDSETDMNDMIGHILGSSDTDAWEFPIVTSSHSSSILRRLFMSTDVISRINPFVTNRNNGGGDASSSSETAQEKKAKAMESTDIYKEIYSKTQATNLVSLPNRLTSREVNGSFGGRTTTFLQNRHLPRAPHLLADFNARTFCGTFSKDGDKFVSAGQDSDVHVFDCHNGAFVPVKRVKARDVGWSVLDVCLSPCGERFIYSSWSRYVHMCSIYQHDQQHLALNMEPSGHMHFCVFSAKFSPSGNELLCGCNYGPIYMYDLEATRRTLCFEAHIDDTNTVCYADDSGNIFYSGSDDTLVKVWDRRTVDDSRPHPVCVFSGHEDGVTHVESRGDARYLISNSKDHSIRLWDLRRPSRAEDVATSNSGFTRTGVSWGQMRRRRPQRRVPDTSVMMYSTHMVRHTLVRCQFSPERLTGQRFIYTGSSDGQVVVYDVLTGMEMMRLRAHESVVREVAWHPRDAYFVTSGWDGRLIQWNNDRNDFFKPTESGRNADHLFDY